MSGYVLAEAFAKSEPNSIQSAMNQWRGPHGEGERQYAWGWFEAGLQSEHWGLGAVWRRDYDLRFSQDAADLYGSIKNRRDLPVGRVYNVDVQAHILWSSGLRASWRGELAKSLQVEVGLSILRSNYGMDGSLQGAATITGPKQYDYTAVASYAYTRDILFDRQVPNTLQDGTGVALDAAWRWQVSPDWLVQGRVRDLGGNIWWRQFPYTVAAATSDRTQTDSDGYTRWAPLISGVEATHATYRQTLPTRGELEVGYMGWRLAPVVGANYQFGDWLPKVGLTVPVASWKLTGWVWPTTRALGVDATHGKWKLGASMDVLQWRLVKTVGFRVGYSL